MSPERHRNSHSGGKASSATCVAWVAHAVWDLFYLKKAFDAVDRECALKLLEGYGVGPKMRALIRAFWDQAVMACRAQGNFGRVFTTGRGVTQGGPLLPWLFNIVVDTIVRELLRQMFRDAAAKHGLGGDSELVRTFLALFYSDDG